ncbi:hypothetical protein [Fibrella aquatilis]|uniref:Uncharacterized protein n=1 Tax=Fibrella aquatilis TaxID=2817059 RepID=A0A939G3C6_9BACT|nr:hypothetical protein [Fibrella aquatilis]MBO0930335.1 hypothetical protein [Fibrella aquatilis]
MPSKPTNSFDFPMLDLGDVVQQRAYVDRFTAAVAAAHQVPLVGNDCTVQPRPAMFVYVPLIPLKYSAEPGDIAAFVGAQGLDLADMAKYLVGYHYDFATELAMHLTAALCAVPDPYR